MSFGLESISLLYFIPVILLISTLIYLYVRAYIPRQLLIFIIRSVIVLLFLFIFLKPGIIKFDSKEHSKKVVVLIDASNSMNSSRPTSRIKKVKGFINGKAIQRLEEEYDVMYYLFSDYIEKVDKENINRLVRAFPKNTDILTPVKTLIYDLKDHDLACIYVVSDGRHNTAIFDYKKLESLKIPIYTIGVDKEVQKDISITKRDVSYRFFKDVKSLVQADLYAYNLSNRKVNVYLKQGKKVLAIKSIKFKDDISFIPLEFEVTPQSEGDIEYTIHVDKLREELSHENNTCKIKGRVNKNKIRVLYLCGGPNWEYRFLREVLKSNPMIELVSFIILRRLNSVQPITDKELSLIPFPAKEIFEKEIYNFDLVILENFSNEGLFSSLYMENIKKMVEDYGRSLLVIGGEKSSIERDYTNNPLEDLIPVYYNEDDQRLGQGLFKLKVLDSTHPIMLLDEDEDANERLWTKMPDLDGIIRLRAKDSANVLAVNPNLRDSSNNYYPVIVEWKKKNGRVLYLTNNTTWRWSFNKKQIGRTNYYQKFWLKTIDYLTQPEKYSNIILGFDRDEISAGDNIKLQVKINPSLLKDDLKDLKIEVSLKGPNQDRANIKSELKPGKMSNLMYGLDYTPKEAGRYDVYIKLLHKDKMLSTAYAFFDVNIPKKEMQDITSDNYLLQEIANTTNAKFYYIDDIDEQNILPDVIREYKPKIIMVKNIWDNKYLFFVIIMLFLIELYIRKKKGMI